MANVSNFPRKFSTKESATEVDHERVDIWSPNYCQVTSSVYEKVKKKV